jgi:hypothetical protein
MEFRFDGNEWPRLTLEERVRRCKLMAHEARSRAESASSADLQEGYSKLAAEWLKLAAEIEHGKALRQAGDGTEFVPD